MIKSKENLVKKLFIIVWCILFVHIALKLTFNYWQPYVIPNDRLQVISDFIDNNKWIKDLLDFFFYTFNGLIMILTGLCRLWFKNKKHAIITIISLIIVYLSAVLISQSSIITLFIALGLPLILEHKKWFTIILSFILNNVFIFFSLWLQGFTNANLMPYLIQVLLTLDYYIMLILCYFLFYLKRKR